MKLIKISQKTCVPCQILSNYLNDKNVEYEEIDLEDDRSIIKKYDITSVPVLVLLDGEEVIDSVTGFNPANTSEVDSLISKLG